MLDCKDVSIDFRVCTLLRIRTDIRRPTVDRNRDYEIVCIEPFYFGEAGRKLFGCYHVPLGRTRNAGVVICPPLFTEYFRTHSSLRRLAHKLATQGLHVLRFDYFGTGDSGGDSDMMTLSDCETDILTAVSELQALSGIHNVRLLSVRVGAIPAVRASLKTLEVDRVCMWDPIVSGQRYLQELRDRHRALVASHESLSSDDKRKVEWNRELLGFRISSQLLTEIEELSMAPLSELAAGGAKSIFILNTMHGGTYEEFESLKEFQTDSSDRDIELCKVEFNCDWFNYWDAEFFPHDILNILAARV